MKRLILALVLLAAPVMAVEPDEVLDDPVLEERARDLSQGLRCPVCRNESIDESNAEIAKDIRVLVRERLLAGDSDEEVIQFMVDRYGEFVLLKPTLTGANLILYLAAPGLLLIGGGIAFTYMRRRATPEEDPGLNEADQARLKELLND